MEAKHASRSCLNCGKPFRPARFTQYYCRPVCTQSARRIRAREAARGIGRVPVSAWTDGGYPTGEAVIGRCRWCRTRKQLRYDTFGSVTDAYIDALPEFCSADCLASWFEAAGPGAGRQVDESILRLIMRGKGKQAEPDDFDEDDWGDYDED